MNKKEYLVVIILLIFSINFISLASSAENTTDSKAIACVNSKIQGKCNTLTTEEKIFSLLAVGKCKTELNDVSAAGICWPDSGCKIKTTAQAILALREAGETTTSAENWLIDQSTIFKNADWFLQIETNSPSKCNIETSKGSSTVEIDEFKKIVKNKNSGSCLSIYNDYWLRIATTCFEEEFTISCNESFTTSLIYKKKTSNEFFVSEGYNSAPGEGTTKEKLQSFCFSEGPSCDYEGTLWAAIVLKSLGRDVSNYIPYLVVLADENSKYIPQAFLYYLTDNFRQEIFAKQKGDGKWWSESGNKFYDTAVALLPFQNEESLYGKSGAKDWLKEVQGSNGCWQDNIKDTSFLIYSLWKPRTIAPVVSSLDCKGSGYFCRSSESCSNSEGNELEGYSGCGTLNVCCDKEEELLSCSDQNGKLCLSSQICAGGDKISAVDASSGKVCCYKGECVSSDPDPTPTPTCELNEGTCRSSCLKNEESTSSYSCEYDYQSCCIKKDTPAWVPLLIGIFILLALIGIVLRDKIKLFFLKNKKPKTPPKALFNKNNPRFPPSSSVYPGAIPRRIIPPNQQARQPLPRPPIRRAPVNKEVEDVLKKLKEIGK